MQRIQYRRYGGPKEMRLEAYELPAPAKGEIVVRVKAASVNPVDWKLRRGDLKLMVRGPFPRVMGSDFSGIVESVGSSVTRFRPGDEVFGTVQMGQSGSFAETLITKEMLAAKKPPSLPHEEAATLPIAGLTAWRALSVTGRLKPGQAVFINGALGGVGHAAVAIAKVLGASVIAGRVGPSSLPEGQAIGLDTVLDYTKKLPASLNGKFDIVFDTNGSLTITEGNALINRSGAVIDINPTGSKFFRSLFSRRRKIVFAKPSAEILQKLAGLASSGKLSIPIGRTAKLEEGVQLIADLEAGRRTNGKAVILVS